MRVKLKALVAKAERATAEPGLRWGCLMLVAALAAGAALAQAIDRMIGLSETSAYVFGTAGFVVGLGIALWIRSLIERQRLKQVAKQFRGSFAHQSGDFNAAFARLATLDSDGKAVSALMLALANWVRIAETPASVGFAGAPPPPTTLPPPPLDALPPLPPPRQADPSPVPATTGDTTALPLQPCAPDDPAQE